MDAEARANLSALTGQFVVLFCAVEAIIAAHPDRALVKTYFDQLLAQFQASGEWANGTDADRQTVRVLAAKLFSEAQQPPL